MKKFTALLLLFAVLLTIPAFSASFSDIKGHWGESYIENLAMKGVISGMGDGKFKPDDFVTREQFLKMLMIVTADCANDRLNFENPPVLNLTVEKSAFSDVSTDRWSYYYIKEATEKVIWPAEFNYKFKPVKNITREEAAIWMARALGLGYGTCDFKDNDLIKRADRVGAAYEKGLITGFDDGTFRPTEGLTRAQAAVMLKRAEDYKLKSVLKTLPDEVKSIKKDLDKDGKEDKIKVYSDGERYVVTVNGLPALGGLSHAEEQKYYSIDLNKSDSYVELAVLESYYASGALAFYRYTGEHFYMMGYIESAGGISLKTDGSSVGEEWGAISVNKDGTITANVGEQFVHTMLVRKHFGINDKNRIVPLKSEFSTVGDHSKFVVVNPLTSRADEMGREGISLKKG